MSEKIIKFPEQPKTTEKIISETVEAIRQRRLEEEKYILCGDDVIGVMEENETISDVARRQIRNSLGLSMLGHLTKQALISKEDLQKNSNLTDKDRQLLGQLLDFGEESLKMVAQIYHKLSGGEMLKEEKKEGSTRKIIKLSISEIGDQILKGKLTVESLLRSLNGAIPQLDDDEQISILDRMEEAATERKELQEGIDKLKGF